MTKTRDSQSARDGIHPENQLCPARVYRDERAQGAQVYASALKASDPNSCSPSECRARIWVRSAELIPLLSSSGSLGRFVRLPIDAAAARIKTLSASFPVTLWFRATIPTCAPIPHRTQRTPARTGVTPIRSNL